MQETVNLPTNVILGSSPSVPTNFAPVAKWPGNSLQKNHIPVQVRSGAPINIFMKSILLAVSALLLLSGCVAVPVYRAPYVYREPVVVDRVIVVPQYPTTVWSFGYTWRGGYSHGPYYRGGYWRR